MAILKSKQKPGHAAGIYADMTLDGPEIGTLVAIVDRAKNLPNRKTMGKQDPYCAMRLAKEARKTQTDRRGGQTPRWDEELRFIVHDSPDYYKLKCSIFNDDKKTDLIGEAWVDLTDVVKPGGGQSDLWQQLNFKGKYAGDVRIELTYYDTREQPVSKRKDQLQTRTDSTLADSLNEIDASMSGSRQLGPRDIKRRPLPQSPSEHMPQQIELDTNRQQTLPPLPPTVPIDDDRHQALPLDEPRDDAAWLDTPYDDPQYASQSASLERPQPWQYPLGKNFRDYHNHPRDYSQPRNDLAEQARPLALQPLSHQQDLDQFGVAASHLTNAHSEPTTPYSGPPYPTRPTPTETHSDSHVPHNSHYLDRQHTSPTKALTFQDSPLRQSLSNQDIFPGPSTHSEAPPPLPPKHRDTPPRRSRSDYPPSAYAPQPLRVTPQRHSISERSPLQSIEDNFDTRTEQVYSDRPYAVRRSSHDYPPNESYDGQIEPYRGQPYAPVPQPVQRPQANSRRNSYEIRGPSLGDQMVEEPELIQPHPEYRLPRQPQPVPAVMRDPSPGLQPAIARKAVGDQPKRLSNVPFGPDSYDILNPSSSPGANKDISPGDADKPRDQAPIIGNDGRVIDPSDHLPFDTWAPEPDRKVKKPEHIITIRSKNDRPTPAGARSSPLIIRHGGSASSTPQRPISMITTSPMSLPASFPLTPSGRNRLQKPAHARPLPVQPTPPAQPQLYTSSPAVASSPALVTSPSDRYAQHRRNSYQRRPSMDDRPSSITRPPLSEYQVPVGNSYNPRGSGSAYADNTRQNIPLHKPSPRGVAPQTNRVSDQRNSYYGGGSYENEYPVQGYDNYRGHERQRGSGHYKSELAAEMSMIDLGPSRGYDRLPPRTSRGYGY